VYTALRRVSQQVHYYKTASGREVDFIVQMPDRSRLLIQCCESVADPRARNREVEALKQAMDELSVNAAYIVTRHDEDTIVVGARRIDVVPAWQFLLNLPEA
jgi:hypothetical protein